MTRLLKPQMELLDKEQTRSLLQISKIVNADFDLNNILQTIVDTITSNSIWPIAGIAIVDEDKQEEWFAAQRGFEIYKSIEEDRWALDVCLSPQAIKSGETVVVPDFLELEGPPGVRDYCLECGYRSALLVPLKEIYPNIVLWLCTPDVTDFTKSDIAFAECIASQVAIAYRNVQLYEKSRSQASELNKVHYTMGQMLNMVVKRETPEEIIIAAAKLIENPIWFENQFGNRIPDSEGPAVPNSIEKISLLQYTSNNKNAMAIPVVSGEEHFGWLLSLDSVKPFEELDTSFLSQLALIFSLVFLKERVSHEVESKVRMEFFSSLVAPNEKYGISNNSLTKRATALRVELPHPARVALIDIGVGNSLVDLEFQDKLARATTAVSRWLPNRIVAIQDQHIALLISPGEEIIISKRLLELEYYFSKTSPLIAVGEIVESIDLYGESLASALKVLTAARHLKLERSLIKSEDLGVYSILFDPNRQEQLELFSYNILGPLLENDPQGIYWETIKNFFEQNFHLESTAETLNIHISTLRYRLDRIRVLSKVDWKSSDARLETHIAILVEKWKRYQFV